MRKIGILTGGGDSQIIFSQMTFSHFNGTRINTETAEGAITAVDVNGITALYFKSDIIIADHRRRCDCKNKGHGNNYDISPTLFRLMNTFIKSIVG